MQAPILDAVSQKAYSHPGEVDHLCGDFGRGMLWLRRKIDPEPGRHVHSMSFGATAVLLRRRIPRTGS